jgi:hypothetical protein
LYPLQLLLGGLLIEAEAGEIIFAPGPYTNSENVVQYSKKAAAIIAEIACHVLDRSFFVLS